MAITGQLFYTEDNSRISVRGTHFVITFISIEAEQTFRQTLLYCTLKLASLSSQIKSLWNYAFGLQGYGKS